MTAEFRRAIGGRIDRSTALRFRFDGQRYTGHPGDTLASALLANGVRTVARSTYRDRPRGIYAAGAEEPNALVSVGGAPLLPATQVELYDGLQAFSLTGKGVLPTDGTSDVDTGRDDKVYVHCDVLVVGGGPAGLAAARAAGTTGARVLLLDEGTELGGDLLSDRALLDGAPAMRWVEDTVRRLSGIPEVQLLTRTTAIGYYDHNYVVAVERSAPAPVAGHRLWHIRARQVVLATGAHERPIAFTDNDRPGIMLAGATRSYVNRYAVLPGRRAVVFTAVSTAYAAALDMHRAGVEVAAVVDVRPESPEPTWEWPTLLRWHGVEVLRGREVVGTEGTEGTERLTAVHIGRPGGDRVRTIECDLLAVSGGWNPAVQLFCQTQGRLAYDETLAAFVPGTSIRPERSAGAARGVFGTAACVTDGYAAGTEAAVRTGFDAPLPPPVPHEERRAEEPGVAFWSVPARADGETERQFVDLQRDATVADILRTTGVGMRSVEHVKRYTTIGTASDQGKTSGVVTVGILADVLGRSLLETGTTTARPPYTPVRIAAFAGRERGRLSDPTRVTALHEWHVANGAVFEDVGQWKRPWYFPRAGEDMDTAVLRECRAAREAVAMMDASTLGKIDLQGPDVGEFLDRMYTNRMSTLRVGRCRYGLLCKADGMVFDDGVVVRLGEQHYVATTTTGNAAAVLDWMEEWLQTEWPDLRVFCTSVTDHWATVALAGPYAREVLAALAPDLDVSVGGFPFMAAREAELDLGIGEPVPARVFRVSFSGELAYEINVVAWHALPLWEVLLAIGRSYGITPYGTETMHVLRAEKGFPIIGQETDGTVTPQDLGMSWVVSTKKADFLGRRSQFRPDTVRTDRLRLVGLLPDEPETVLVEGTQLVAAPDRPAIVGHVTSSYRSAELGRSFALAMLYGGTAESGERVYAPLPDRTVPVTVTEPVFYDAEGARRDG